MNYPKQLRLFFILSNLLVVSFASFTIWQTINLPAVRLYVLDVGQGDAILIRTPGGKTILIDGGPDNTVIYNLGQHLPYFDRTIDLVVLTHPDSDHLFGLNEVLTRYNVEAVLLTGVEHSSATHQQWLSLLSEKKVRVLVAGEVTSVAIEPGVSLNILYPAESLAGQKLKQVNESSIITRLVVGEVAALLTGDTTVKIEQLLVEQHATLQADILKVGHHGSRSSSALTFLQAVNPAIALLSAGRDNKFNHPHPEVVQRYEALGIPIISTQTQGDIIVELNAQEFHILPVTIWALEK